MPSGSSRKAAPSTMTVPSSQPRPRPSQRGTIRSRPMPNPCPNDRRQRDKPRGKSPAPAASAPAPPRGQDRNQSASPGRSPVPPSSPRGPPPKVNATAKEVRQITKITAKAPGSTRRISGHSSVTKNARRDNPSDAASRNRSAGIDSQPCKQHPRGERQVEEDMRQHNPVQPVDVEPRPAQRRQDPVHQSRAAEDRDQPQHGDDHRQDEGRAHQRHQRAAASELAAAPAPAPAEPPAPPSRAPTGRPARA